MCVWVWPVRSSTGPETQHKCNHCVSCRACLDVPSKPSCTKEMPHTEVQEFLSSDVAGTSCCLGFIGFRVYGCCNSCARQAFLITPQANTKHGILRMTQILPANDPDPSKNPLQLRNIPYCILRIMMMNSGMLLNSGVFENLGSSGIMVVAPPAQYDIAA